MKKQVRLTSAQKIRIRELYHSGSSKSEISRLLEVPRSTVIYQLRKVSNGNDR